MRYGVVPKQIETLALTTNALLSASAMDIASLSQAQHEQELGLVMSLLVVGMCDQTAHPSRPGER
jgi:hypothetical protein